MPSLQENFTLAQSSPFRERVVMGLNKTATDQLLLVDDTIPNRDRVIQAIRAIVSTDVHEVIMVARMLVSQGLNDSSTDAAIQNALDGSFTAFAHLFDATVDNPVFNP